MNPTTGRVEVWRCDWESHGTTKKKVWLSKVDDEKAATDGSAGAHTEAAAICWSYGRTLGNIAVNSPTLIGQFPGRSGSDAILPCDFVGAGKYRNGAARMWCRTHQLHWGTKADIESLDQFGRVQCASHGQQMSYVVSPMTLNVDEHAEVGIWCSMPAALSTSPIPNRPPRIHVHVRPVAGGNKTVDGDVPALSVAYSDKLGLFGSSQITRVNITPPAAFEFVKGLESGREMSCVNCSNCGYPHLDLGSFANEPHRKHFCGNCGRDSTWSTKPIVSTPLKPLHDQFAPTTHYETPTRRINLDNYPGCTYTAWASTPAVIWTAQRPQEFGIHVHVHKSKERIVDDTFGEVEVGGKLLDRSALIQSMIDKTIG